MSFSEREAVFFLKRPLISTTPFFFFLCCRCSQGSVVATQQKAADCDVEYITSFKAIYDRRASTQLEAGLSVGRTLFVCFILILGALLITRDQNRLVLVPIERMMVKMNEIRNNPLAAANMSVEGDAGTGKQGGGGAKEMAGVEEEDLRRSLRILFDT